MTVNTYTVNPLGKMAFESDSSFATTLMSIMVKEHGAEIFDWEQEVFAPEIEDMFGLSKEELGFGVLDRLQAAVAILESNIFYTYFEGFENASRTLNFELPFFGTLTPVSPDQAAWAVVEAKILDPDGDEYSGEVKAYINCVLKANGICKSPRFLEFTEHKQDVSWVPEEIKENMETEQEIKMKRVSLYVLSNLEKLKKQLSFFNLDSGDNPIFNV